MQKQTKIKMNDINRPKLGGGAPPVQKLEGQAPPTAPQFLGLCLSYNREKGETVLLTSS